MSRQDCNILRRSYTCKFSVRLLGRLLLNYVGVYYTHHPAAARYGVRELILLLLTLVKVHTSLPGLSFQRNPRFTGRESQLAQLEEKLFTKDATTRIEITGLEV
jgi:hypothetical protein